VDPVDPDDEAGDRESRQHTSFEQLLSNRAETCATRPTQVPTEGWMMPVGPMRVPRSGQGIDRRGGDW